MQHNYLQLSLDNHYISIPNTVLTFALGCGSRSYDEKLFCAAIPTTTEDDEEMEKDLSKESVRHLLEHWIE
jgi:hypothetical protein